MTDRKAPAKEVSAVTDELTEAVLDVLTDIEYLGHDGSHIGCDQCGNVKKLRAILQSRRSSPVREGDLGQATPKTASRPSRTSSKRRLYT